MREERAGRVTIALLLLLAAMGGNYFLGPLPFALPGAAYDGQAYSRIPHDLALDAAVKMIPAGAVVSANNNVGAQLAARRVAYVFPYYAAADWVLVDEQRPFVFDMEDLPAYEVALNKLEHDKRFASVYASDGVQVFKRIAP